MGDEAAKKRALENHLKEDWRTVHDIWPHVGATSGTMVVSSNHTSTTTTAANVTGLGFQVAANKIYGFRFFLHANSAAAQTAIDYQFTGPGGANIYFVFSHWGVTPVFEEEQVETFSTKTTAANQSTTHNFDRIEGIVLSGANAGLLQLQFSSEANDEVTIHRGSWGTWHLLD